MKTLVALLLFLPGLLQGQTFQLAPPQTGIGAFQSPLFTDSAVVVLRFDVPGASIRYTLDGSLPGPASPVFKNRIVLRSSCALTAVAVHPDYRDSEPVSVQFVRLNPDLQPVQTELVHAPAAKYAGKGATTLCDHDKGHEQLNSGHWLGFEGKDLEYTVDFRKKKTLKGLILSTLSAPASWVLPPAAVELWADTGKKGAFEKVAVFELPPAREGESGIRERLFFLDFKPRKARRWRVVARNGGPLPEWHPGKGSPAWLFVDEVIFQ